MSFHGHTCKLPFAERPMGSCEACELERAMEANSVFNAELDAFAAKVRASTVLNAEDYAVRINARDDDPLPPSWEQRARYAEAALRTILGSPGITLGGAQQIAQNYFDGLSATGATVSNRTDTLIAQQSGKSGNPERDPLLAAERKLSIMHAAVLRAIVEIEAEFPHERPEWVGNVRQMLNDAHCAMFPPPTPRA